MSAERLALLHQQLIRFPNNENLLTEIKELTPDAPVVVRPPARCFCDRPAAINRFGHPSLTCGQQSCERTLRIIVETIRYRRRAKHKGKH